MKLSATRDVLLKPLQAVIGVVERRQTMPILSNILLVAKDGELAVTATDLEVELVAQAAGFMEVGLRSCGVVEPADGRLLGFKHEQALVRDERFCSVHFFHCFLEHISHVPIVLLKNGGIARG